ncbi:MAG: CopD family protein [Actinomycetota bacterium]|nr:CopD family protein [Actinomycetota bacterium]
MLAAVVMPQLRRNADAGTIRVLAAATGRRFGALTTVALLPVLVVTGLLLAWHHGVSLPTLFATAYGQVLAAKMALVVVVFAVGALHGVVARKRSPTLSRAVALVTLSLSVVIVLLASVLGALS